MLMLHPLQGTGGPVSLLRVRVDSVLSLCQGDSACPVTSGCDPTGLRFLSCWRCSGSGHWGRYRVPRCLPPPPCVPPRSVVFLGKRVLSGTRCSETILCVSRSSPRISCFSKEAWLPFQKRGPEIRSEHGAPRGGGPRPPREQDEDVSVHTDPCVCSCLCYTVSATPDFWLMAPIHYHMDQNSLPK